MLSLNNTDYELLAGPSLKRADLLSLPPPPNLFKLDLQIHRNFAFEFIGSVLPPFLWLSHLTPSIAYGPYDDTLSFAKPDPGAVQIIALDFARYTGQSISELRKWLVARLEVLRGQSDRPVIVSNWPSDSKSADQFNAELESAVRSIPSVSIWDVDAIARELRSEFYDERTASAKGTRLSNRACIELARSLGLTYLPGALYPRIKAIALDLDNTLFKGVLGEDGVEAVRISDAHAAIYKQLLRLREEGVFLAVLSKNDEADFLELCEKRSDFLLKPERFSARSITWDSKALGLARIAAQLRIGVESILVVDDNPGEIAQLAALPFPPFFLYARSAAETLFWLQHFPTLNGYRANSASSLRVLDLDASRKREHLRASTSASDYLRELQIEIDYALNPSNFRGRLAELSQKTNQFNTGLQRFPEVEVARRLESPGCCIISIAMRDRFSDSGIIGAIFAKVDGRRLLVEEVCVSCRALGRGVESSIIARALSPILENHDLAEVGFRFRAGPRNAPARTWLAEFTGIQDLSDGIIASVPWRCIPQLQEHLNAPIHSRWEPVPA